MRRIACLLVVLASGAAACSSDAPDEPAAAPPVEEAATDAAEPAADPGAAAAPDEPSNDEADELDDSPESTEPEEPAGAASSFSADHLLLGVGSRFISADMPAYISAAEATWLGPDDVVLGVVRGETAVAFPVMQMAYHHIANVEIDGEPYLVTY